MNTKPTLCVTQQGTLDALYFPLFKTEGSSRWVILQGAVFKFYQDGGCNYWFAGIDPYYEVNFTHALALAPCDRKEVGEKVLQEIALLQTLITMI